MKRSSKNYLLIFFLIILIQIFTSSSALAKDRPLLIVGDDVYYPPYSFLDENGEPAGFNIDLITALTKAIGYDVEIRLDEWSKVREALEKGEIDIIGGMSPSEERKEIYSFSVQHSVVVRDIFSRKGEVVTSLDDLKGKKIVVQKADLFSEYLKSFDPEYKFNILEVASAEEAIRGVSDGFYDYAAIMKFPALYVIKEFNITNVQTNNLSLPVVAYGIAVLKDNEDLLMLLNTGLQLIKATGEYDEIYDRWISVYDDNLISDYIREYWWIPVIVGLILFLLLALAATLRYLVGKRTKELEEANLTLKIKGEEIEANLEELTAAEEELRNNYEQLRISEEKRRSIIEALPDWVFSFSKEGKFIQYHKNHTRGLLHNKEEFMGKYISDFLPKDLTEEALAKIEKVLIEGKLQTFSYDLERRGKAQSFEMRLVKSDDQEVLGILRDVTAERKYQENMEYLSSHDALTDLYNRHYFEKIIIELDKKENLPLCLIMADVNGLKLINDSFGHKVGDQLLIKVGEVFKKACTSGEYVFRIGGDEFVILFPMKKPGQAEELIKRIKKIAEDVTINTIELSISFGWAIKTKESQSIQDIFKESENQMYKRKLFEAPSIRGKTINAIINTLYEKNQREEEHSRRVSDLVTKFAEVLGLTEQEVQEIKTTGLLHDIGKIAIDERILNKEGTLTKDEYEEIKLHPEIGYRILSSVNDMSDMADYVLSHHEKWDGSGYPRGIKGEEIPLQSRMIAIVDAYDAMVSYRTYRKSKTKEEAIEELRKYSGIQFDQKLVEIFIEIILNRE